MKSIATRVLLMLLAAGLGSVPSLGIRGAEKDATKADPFAWKALFDGKTLEGWKSPNFGGQGEVTVKDGSIVMEAGNNMTGVVYTGRIPRIDYELTLEGRRLSGNDFFATTTFPVGKDCCSFVAGGWGGTLTGLSCIDFYDASDNPTTGFYDFKEGQWYRFRIRVTAAKIEVWVEDEKAVNQVVPGRRISIRDEEDLCQPFGRGHMVHGGGHPQHPFASAHRRRSCQDCRRERRQLRCLAQPRVFLRDNLGQPSVSLVAFKMPDITGGFIRNNVDHPAGFVRRIWDA